MTASQRLEYRRLDILSRIESGRPFSVSAYMEAEGIGYNRVYPVLLKLEAEGKIRRSGEQSIYTRGGYTNVPSWAPVLDKSAFPESLRATSSSIDADDVISREATAIYAYSY